MNNVVRINANLNFQDLNLSFDPIIKNIEIDMAPLETILSDSGISEDQVADDLISSVIVCWYENHLSNGGKPDPVAEQVMADYEVE